MSWKWNADLSRLEEMAGGITRARNVTRRKKWKHACKSRIEASMEKDRLEIKRKVKEGKSQRKPNCVGMHRYTVRHRTAETLEVE